jgi:hypothetical protein
MSIMAKFVPYFWQNMSLYEKLWHAVSEMDIVWHTMSQIWLFKLIKLVIALQFAQL